MEWERQLQVLTVKIFFWLFLFIFYSIQYKKIWMNRWIQEFWSKFHVMAQFELIILLLNNCLLPHFNPERD